MKITLKVAESVDSDQLRRLVEQHSYGRYLEDWTLPVDAARRHLFDQLSELPADRDHAHVTVASEDGEPLGLLFLRRSAWDSEVFGFPVGSIDHLLVARQGHDRELEVVRRLLEGFESWREQAGVRFAVIKLPARQLPAVHAAEESGFRYMETWLRNRLDLKTVGDLPAAAELRAAAPEEERTMLRWARGAFATQRFHADPHLSRDAAEALYEKWIHDAFRDPDRPVVVAEIDGSPACFIEYRARDLTRRFGLRAAYWRMSVTHPDLRGTGNGPLLWGAFFRHLLEAGFQVLEGGLSLRNLHSANLHARFDFRATGMLVVFHRWWAR